MDYYTANTFKIISIVALILFVLCLIILVAKKCNKKFLVLTTLLTISSGVSVFYFQHVEDNPKLSTATDHKERYDFPESSSSEEPVSESSSELSSSASSDNTSSTKTEASSSAENSSSTKAKSSQEELADKLPKNVEYGYIDKNDFTKETMYHSKEFDYVYVSIGDHDIIKTVKLDFKDLPLASLDDALEYIQDWTSRDTQLQSKVDDRTYIYHSASLNIDYEIKLTFNSQGEISRVAVFPVDALR
ncbi:hypothetical protein FAX13_05720 [Ligilactobacillus animalis]|nr:hypothetical protein FAX13_05720 [Ligilactobacillus animalis]